MLEVNLNLPDLVVRMRELIDQFGVVGPTHDSFTVVAPSYGQIAVSRTLSNSEFEITPLEPPHGSIQGDVHFIRISQTGELISNPTAQVGHAQRAFAEVEECIRTRSGLYYGVFD